MSFLDDLKNLVSDLPIIGEFVGDTTSSLSKDQQKRYEQLRQNYLDQIGPNREARMQALQQTMSLFQPMADTMQRHTGQQYDFSGLFQHPWAAGDLERAKIAEAQKAVGEAEKARNEAGQPVDWNALGKAFGELSKKQGK